MDLTALRTQLAQLRTRIIALVMPTLQRAFNQLEWDEGLHPRGANGKFIGGDGLAKAREAYHLDKALKGMDQWAKSQPAEVVADAKARITWRGVKGYKAVQQHLGHLRYDALQLGKHDDTAQTRQELATLREWYRRRQVAAHMNPAAYERLGREIAILDSHMRALGMPPDDAKGKHVAPSDDIKQQIERGIVADGERTGHVPGKSIKPLR